MDDPDPRRPVSALQAARLARGWLQEDVADRIRQLCPGHGGPDGCRLPWTRISEWERHKERPTLRHLELLCRVFQMSPDDLGLITWRDPKLPLHAEQVTARLRRDVTAEVLPQLRRDVTAEVLAAVTACLRGLANGDSPPG